MPNFSLKFLIDMLPIKTRVLESEAVCFNTTGDAKYG